MKAVFSICLALNFGFGLSNPVIWNSTALGGELNEGENLQSLQHARIGDKRCMKVLGCFVLTEDFYHPIYRPVNFLPQDRATIDTGFHLYTKVHPKDVYYLDVNRPDTIKSSPLNPKHQTKFIVHGFIDSTLYGKWMEVLKDNLLLHGEYNVIVVDWSKGNGAPYTQASANSRVVGAEIDLMIQTLQKLLNVSPMDCHIIGHSLGSHIAGYAGERIKKLGRISAVDPAQPYFQNMPPSVRIDPTDADFVDVIHTDSASLKFLALGMSQAVGHVDFYPNNGMSQPGCSTAAIHSIFLEGLIDAGRRFISCNHQRAVDFYTYSINYRKAPPVGYECKRWEDYLNGKCADCGKEGQKCAVMGIRADEYKSKKNDSKSRKLYLTTSGGAPFWVHSYQVTMKLLKPQKGFTDRKGDINLKIEGSKTNSEINLSTSSRELIHGATYTFLVTLKEDLGSVQSVSFGWTSASWSIFTKHTIFLDYVKVLPMNVIEPTERSQETKKFCNRPGRAIESKQMVILNSCV